MERDLFLHAVLTFWVKKGSFLEHLVILFLWPARASLDHLCGLDGEVLLNNFCPFKPFICVVCSPQKSVFSKSNDIVHGAWDCVRSHPSTAVFYMNAYYRILMSEVLQCKEEHSELILL